MPLNTQIIEADLENPAHVQKILDLISTYAEDSMGGGKPLAASVQRDLISGLRAHPGSIIFLAYQADAAVGIAVCFTGFSTFAARPLINVHDLAVQTGFRHQGIGQLLLESVAKKAQQLGCCKVTLEVREDNTPARQLYDKSGFQSGSAPMLFLSKALPNS